MPRTSRLALCLGSAMIASLATRASAQTAHAPADTLTTKLGVYTFQQAQRGSDVYAGNCRSCHAPETHAGPMFTSMWQGRSLAELYAYIRDRMPKNDPGSLSAEEYIDVIAYLMRMNKQPMGELELAADSLALAKIRIDITPKGSP
ncbi:MAG TPA: cytochrome c [Gemmatimonadaceae bacterium]|nr:cytochrome c [Gemmatimonadaceae bacterium]